MCTIWSVRSPSSTSTAACSRWCRSASDIRRSGELLSGAGERLLIYLGLGAALGLLASWLLSRRIKRHTRGLEVAEIAGLADHREALLHSIREGVVGVGNDGEITVLNDSAKELLDLTDAAIGQPCRHRRSRPRGGRLPALRRRRARRRRGRQRQGDRHADPGFGAEQARREHRRSAHRHGDHDARQHRTGLHAGPAVVPQKRHRHAARADPRVLQSVAHHLGAGAARRVRRGPRSGGHPDPASCRDQ